MITVGSKTIFVPMNSSKYAGSKRICKIRFKGRIEAPSGTLPFAAPVKIKYQSVHGVTSSIINPICKSLCPSRNIFDRAHAKRDVEINQPRRRADGVWLVLIGMDFMRV
jgi:hypothetical protein